MSWVDKLMELYSDDDFEDEILDDYFSHTGVAHDENPPGRGSGRYAFGSGGRALQHQYDLYYRYRKLKASGMSDTEIAKGLGLYLTDERGNIKYDEKGEPRGSVPLLRAKAQMAKNDVYNDLRSRAVELREGIDPDTGKKYTNQKIAEILNLPNESSVRSLLKNEDAAANRNKTQETVDKLKELVGDSNYIDVGRGAELSLGVSKDRLNVALEMLKEEGYDVQSVHVNQVGMNNGTQTTVLTLCPKGAKQGDAFANRFDIKPVEDPDGNNTLTLLGIQDPVRVDKSRIDIRFDEMGGTEKDGVIEIRAVKGEDGVLRSACEDLSLGNAKYAQVRIAVDGDKYIKGMAVYNTDLPKDIDILVNSNKSAKKIDATHDKYDVALKEMKTVKEKDGSEHVDPDNPFGATVYQTNYISKDGEKKLSAINIVGDVYGVDKHQEGAWDDWSRNLPSQFLGKQSEALIKQQLKLKVSEKQQEYEEILALNNPVVKKQMLLDFADGCDAAAVDLKAAPIGGQRVQVLLPLTSIKENEIYAPNYENGTTVALVRFPHTGPFETPIVKVNNNNKEAKAFLEDARGQAKDAIGISQKTAGILSGADFDGDTAIVIPMTRKNRQGEFEKVNNIKGIGNGQEELPGLKGFNPSAAYPGTDDKGNPLPGVKLMDKRTKGLEMGRVSNLITDMSIKGCEDPNELARAVKYSMVVIDAEKHKLNYRQAEKDYNIAELRNKYQNNKDGSHGVSTLLSRAKSPVDVPQRKIGYDIDPKTGKKIYTKNPHRFYQDEVKVRKPASEEYKKEHPNAKYEKNEKGKWVYEINPKTGKPLYEKTGKINERMQKSTRMAEHDDAYELLSDNPSPKEIIYADFANKMKAMGNEARKEYLATPKLKMKPEAKKLYSKEVASLNKKLNDALKNAPKERQAQLLATQIINQKIKDNPDMDAEERKRMKGQALNGARKRTGALKARVIFTDKEWEAVNAGAISESKLKLLLKNADSDNYKKLATPKSSRISESTANRVQQLLSAGWTREQIKDAGYASIETIKKVESGTW